MRHPKIHRLGDLQLKILKVLWSRREASVGDVLEDLGTRAQLAYTTVATMLRKMEARGLTAHRIEGRSFIYRATIGAESVRRTMTDHLVDRLFEGSLSAAVSHLLKTRDVDRDELDQLEQLIADQKKRL